MKSSTALWAGVATAVVILCLGGGAAALVAGGYLGGTVQDESSPTVPRTPIGLLPRPSESTGQRPVVTLAAPDRLGGRAKLTDSEHLALAEDVAAEVGKPSYISDVVVAYYGTADPKGNKVYIAAMTTTVQLTRNDFDLFFQSMLSTSGLGQMTGITDIQAGPLGGIARCGDLQFEDMAVAACAWGDESSVGLITWYNRTIQQVSPEFVELRGAVETKASPAP